MKAIEVQDLKKMYKDVEAVKGISFSVEEGELFSFLGENGAGKSTTINMLCTILKKTAGEALLCGHRLGAEDDAIRQKIGIVFQNSVLDGKLTVRENLLSRGSYYGLSKREIEARMAPFSEQFEMEEIWNRRYEKLSGGQRRRVDIMRALINNPKILFLDEPTTGLDPKSRKIVWDHIHYLRREHGMTIFLTTHYMEETANADRVVILDKGRIICNGTPGELKQAHASLKLIWYTQNDVQAEELIRELSGDFDYDADHYSIRVAENPAQFLYRHRDRVLDYEVIKGTMDDVFLNLTGKELA